MAGVDAGEWMSRGAGLTLAELLRVPEFGLTCLTGSEALDRIVRWTHPTELPDPTQYLRGEELVCTVGTTLVDADACDRFAAAVHGAGASGICFGVGDVHEEVPPALVAACRDRGLPLLVAPYGVPFVALGEHLAQTRLRAESDAGERGGRLLVELLSRVRLQAPTAELLDLAAERLGGLLELGEGGRVVESGGHAEGDASGLTTVCAESPDGTSLTWTGSGDAPTATLLATLAHVLGVARHERDVEQDLRRERTGQLLSLVTDRLASPSALTVTLADAGIAAESLVFSVWPPGASRVLASAVSAPLALGETPSATVAITASPDPVRAASDQLGIACGLSRPVPLADAARGLGEARAAFAIARRGGGCVGPDGLTSLDGLLVQQPPDRLRPFVDQLLRPLLASDASRRTAYVRTLTTFLRCDGSLTATAREEFLHVNTVRHRLERVQALTGRDPLVFGDRVALAIALWAHENLGP